MLHNQALSLGVDRTQVLSVRLCVIVTISLLFSGCADVSQGTDSRALENREPVDTREMRCFDFRGFSIHVDSTDEEVLLAMEEPDPEQPPEDGLGRGLFWDGMMWGYRSDAFAGISVNYVTGAHPNWNRFDDDPARRFPQSATRVAGRVNGLGWHGLTGGSIVWATDQLDARPEIRASADSIGRIFAFALDPDDGFETFIVRGREGDVQRSEREDDDQRILRFAFTPDDTNWRSVLVVTYEDSNRVPSAIRLLTTNTTSNRTRVTAARLRECDVEGLSLPRSVQEIPAVYPEYIMLELDTVRGNAD